jgi:antitoxin component YwqK of YwqJK toxin-antitoxin module
MMEGDPAVLSPIPADATEVITETAENGTKQKAIYQIDGKDVGLRFWDLSGVLVMEYGLRDERMHGLFRTWYENGQLEHISFYIEGKEHGEAKQYDENGVQIGSYVMDHGTGVDLWYHNQGGSLAEERGYLDGTLHGFERWWNWNDDGTVNEESHFWNGVKHGIFRRWNRHHKLSRGYPRYFVHGKRVTKREYVRACRTDPTLPSFIAEDNQPFRPLPAGVMSSGGAL